jgi:ribonuclease HI
MRDSTFKSILIFTDGACSGNPGPGGWGAIVATPDGHVRELGAGSKETTNNRMEIAAAIHALKYAQKFSGPIDLYTDSTYVIRGITQWIWGWRKKGWKNGEGEEVSNRDMWEELFKQVMDRGENGNINWLYSRGHIGTPGNERCDQIAVAFSKNKWVDLYDGPLLQYGIAIFDVPENTELPEMRPREEKKAAYSYLSYLQGEVYRHRDWSSCERRVKGRSGAKFKKAMAAADEAKILAEWGLSASVPIKE